MATQNLTNTQLYSNLVNGLSDPRLKNIASMALDLPQDSGVEPQNPVDNIMANLNFGTQPAQQFGQPMQKPFTPNFPKVDVTAGLNNFNPQQPQLQSQPVPQAQPMQAQPSVVDNVMKMADMRQPQGIPAQEELQKQDAPWYSTGWGRSALGGLGTALAVGLTGGNAAQALGYGVMGAGNTANRFQKNRDSLVEQERKDRLARTSEQEQMRREARDDRTIDLMERRFAHESEQDRIKQQLGLGGDNISEDDKKALAGAELLPSTLKNIDEAINFIGKSYDSGNQITSKSQQLLGAMGLGYSQERDNFSQAENIVKGTLLPNLKTFFGGNPTEGERAELLALGGIDPSLPIEVRKNNLKRLAEMLQNRTTSDIRARRLERYATQYSQASVPEDVSMGQGAPQSVQPAGKISAGTVSDGYRFKGGNPNDPNSWEEVR